MGDGGYNPKIFFPHARMHILFLSSWKFESNYSDINCDINLFIHETKNMFFSLLAQYLNGLHFF